MVAFYRNRITATSRSGVGPVSHLDQSSMFSASVSANRSATRSSAPSQSAEASQTPTIAGTRGPRTGSPNYSRIGSGVMQPANAGGPSIRPSAGGGSNSFRGQADLNAFEGRNAATANSSGPAMSPN